MANQIVIIPGNNCGPAEIMLMEVPDNPGDGFTVAHEMSRLAQQVYEMGRRHQMEIHERELRAMLSAAKKALKA